MAVQWRKQLVWILMSASLHSIIGIDDVAVKPGKLVLDPSGNNVILRTTEGNTTFTCTATSYPAANVAWELLNARTGNIPLSGATENETMIGNLLQVVSTLSYTPEKENNGDEIRCSAINRAMSSHIVSSHAKLNIYYPPDSVKAISGYTSSATESSSSINLTCSVNGVPNPNSLIYSWSSECGTDVESLPQISVARNRTMNNNTCLCTAKHPDTGWNQTTQPVTFNFLYHPYAVNPISGYSNPINESNTEILQLTCSASSEANPDTLTYSWSSDCGTEAGSTSQEISVTRNRTINDKICYCTVSHPETGWKENSTVVTFNITYHPYSVSPISGYTDRVTESSVESLQLTCNVNGGANPNNLMYDWSDGCGTDVESSPQISVARNRTMNNNTCYCTAIHPDTGWNQTTQPVTFNFLYHPYGVNPISGYANPVTESSTEELHLRCSVNGEANPDTLTYSWSSDCGTEAGSTSQQISVTRNRTINDKICYCTVSHPETGWEENSTVVTFNITYHPYSVSPISGYTDPVTESNVESLQLTCNVNGGANPDNLIYDWSDGCETGAGSTSQQISVSRNRTMNNKQCYCTVRHPETGWNQTTQPITFSIYYVPDVTVSVNMTPATEGGSTQLECHASAVPDNYTYINWTQHVNGLKVREFTGSTVLNLNNLTFEDTGEYRCNVKNTIGAGTGYENVRVKYVSKLVEARHVNAGMNATATMGLTFIADPQPNVTWYKDGSNSPLDDRLQKFSSRIDPSVVNWTFYETTVTITGYEATLTIRSIQQEDYSVYYAKLDNGLKTDSQSPRFSARLKANDRPQHPLNPEAVCDVTSAVVSWVSQFNGGLTQTFHLHYLIIGGRVTKFEEDPGKDHEGTIKVDSLEAEMNYTFTLLARNNLGDSESVITSCKTKQGVAVSPASKFSDDVNTIAIAAGVAVPIVIIIIVLVTIVIVRSRRQKQHKDSEISETNVSSSNTSNGDMNMDMLTVDTGAYADVNALYSVDTNNQQNNDTVGTVNGDVDKSKEPDNTGTAYAEVNVTKPVKTEHEQQDPMYSQANKTKSIKLDGGTEQAQQGTDYVKALEVEPDTKADLIDNPCNFETDAENLNTMANELGYATVGEIGQGINDQKYPAPIHTDGQLVYANLTFDEDEEAKLMANDSKPKLGSTKTNVPVKPASIKSKEAPTDYASIDFNHALHEQNNPDQHTTYL